jgi:dihydrofolate reductase
MNPRNLMNKLDPTAALTTLRGWKVDFNSAFDSQAAQASVHAALKSLRYFLPDRSNALRRTPEMGKVIVEMSMSLDGFIARSDGRTDEVHAWYSAGDVEVKMPNNELTFNVDPASAEIVNESFKLGANVTGRNTFDDADAWGGDDPMGIPSFIVTHEIPEEWANKESPFTFVTDGVESALKQAQAAAGDKPVGVAGADIAMQCLKLGLLDEIQIHLAPVLLGEGIRLFDDVEEGKIPVQLEQIRVVQAPAVTHLFFRVVK